MTPSPTVQNAPSPPVAPRVRHWTHQLALGVLGSIVAFSITGGLNDDMSWKIRAQYLAICFIYGCSMALAGPYAIPKWIRIRARRSRYSWWVARTMALPFIILTGGAISAAILIPLGLIAPSNAVTLLFPYLRSGRTATVVAAIFISVTFYDYLRERIEAATLALRTKERDEAHARQLAAEAQLASLESRVQPHFLFNTLNSIAALIPQDPAGAERMTGQLASLLRSSLDTASVSLVRVDQELQLVRDYLDIERVRFGERLKYQVELDDGVGAWLIPKMALQTLVENSVKYAVAPRREGGTIVIRGTGTSTSLILEVSDDGPGFDANHIPEGHGLALVRDRLEMAAGDAARLTINAVAGHSTTTIEISDPRLRTDIGTASPI